MTGIKNAATAVPLENGGCKIFFFTDATAKDGALLSRTMEMYEEKGCTFIPMMTGCCHECEDPCISQSVEYCTNFVTDGRTESLFRKKRSLDSSSATGERMYYDLASKSGGTIYLTNKPSNPEEMLDFLEEEVTLGFCPTNEIAGPPPLGYSSEQDCNVTGSCWDRSVGKCYCQSTTEPCPKDPLTPECPVDSVHVFMPDPTNCSMYYECASGNIWRRPCAPGTVFDSTIGSCNHPYLTAPPCGTKVVD
uniref:chitinase n=1 Tax=Ciona savignyi TaxID=51511 RepID=H2Z259_CIOSA